MEHVRNVAILVGPARTGKRAAALAKYGEALRRERIAPRRRVLWLAPTQASAGDVRDALVQGSGSAFLDPGVTTFAGFASRVLQDAGVELRTISSLQRRQLLRAVIDEAIRDGALGHYGPVARSPGFLALVGRTIADCKHRGESAESLQRQARRAGARQRDLAALYFRYQQRLASGKLVDAEGLFHAARQAMAAAPEIGAGLQLAVADGFADFTTAQHEIVGLLAERSAEVLITLVGEQSPQWTESEPVATPAGREELFAKTRSTARVLQRGGGRIAWQAPVADDWPAMGHLERNLFRSFHDLEVPPAEARQSVSRISILAASSEQAEIEAVARRAKQLLLDGVAPGDVVVSFRSTRDVSARMRRALDDYGVPSYIDAADRLAATPLVRSLRALVQLHVEDWPYRTLLRVIADGSLQGLNGGDENPAGLRAAAELCVRHAQLASGRAALAEQVAMWIAEGAEGAAAGTPQAAAGVAGEALGRLGAWLDELPLEGGLSEWIEALDRLARRAGLVEPTPSPEAAAVWSLLVRGLKSVVQLQQWLGNAGPTLAAADFAELLATTAEELPAPQGRDATGRVRMLSAEAARHTRPRHLLVGGLSEQAFPVRRAERSPEAADPVEQQAVVDDGQAPSEMLLFYQLVTRPSETLWLSYPALDSKAQPLPPSPLVVELQRCFGDGPPAVTVQPLGHSHPADRPPLSRAELRRTATVAAQDRRRELLAALARAQGDGHVGAAILDGIEVVASRGRRQEFGPYEGMIVTEAAQRTLAERYGPECLWSPSRLETYGGCPFRFFGEYLLRLAPLPEIALQADMARRGSLLHDTLRRLYERLAEADPGAPPRAEAVADEFQRALAAVVRARPARGLDAALREIERRQIASWATSFAQQHDEYAGGWKQLDAPPTAAHFEVRFGPSRRRASPDSGGGLSTEKPFEVSVGDESLRFTGQIDRIDVGRVGQTVVFNVIDYKTSAYARLSDEAMTAGKQLQLPLYAMAVAELLLADQKATGLTAGYWSVRGKGYNLSARSGGPLTLGRAADGAVQPEPSWLANRDVLLARVKQIVDSIRSGFFPVYNDDLECGRYCPLSTVCRISHVRSLQKTWTPTDAQP